ncbi:MAG: hypothetical protein H0V82_04485 [Candidatus Protochlamydia sp.]|nr:hypothetical protein [Candidatus Protochlamydia sp.]
MTLKVIYSIARAFTLAERAKKLQTQVTTQKRTSDPQAARNEIKNNILSQDGSPFKKSKEEADNRLTGLKVIFEQVEKAGSGTLTNEQWRIRE